MPLTKDDVASIEPVAHYTHDDDQAYLMLYGEAVFETIPIEADYTVADVKLWLNFHKGKDPAEYDLVGPKGAWKMGAGSEVLPDEVVVSEVMGERFDNKWLMQLSLFPKKKNEETGKMESTFETVEEWVPPVRPPLRRHCQRPTTHTLHTSCLPVPSCAAARGGVFRRG